MSRIRTATEIEGVAYFDHISKLPSASDLGKGMALVVNDIYVSDGSSFTVISAWDSSTTEERLPRLTYYADTLIVTGAIL